MTDNDDLIAELRWTAETAKHLPIAHLLTEAADALDQTREAGTCTRREHMHEPYDTITRLQAEVDRLREVGNSLYRALDQAEAQVQAVRALHVRGEAYDGNLDYCERCIEQEGATWPCETVRAALDGQENFFALGG